MPTPFVEVTIISPISLAFVENKLPRILFHRATCVLSDNLMSGLTEKLQVTCVIHLCSAPFYRAPRDRRRGAYEEVLSPSLQLTED